MTRHELGPGIMEVEIKKFDETIAVKFFDCSNEEYKCGEFVLFHDEANSLRDLLTQYLMPPVSSPANRIITKDQQQLPGVTTT